MADRTPSDLADALERAEQFIEAAKPRVCGSCRGTGWVDDENWSPEDWEIRAGVERKEEAGLIPCGACSLGDWSTYRDERTEPTTVGGVLDRDETLALVADLAVLLRRQGEQLDTLRAAIGDPDNLRLLARTFDLPILARIAAAVPQDPEEPSMTSDRIPAEAIAELFAQWRGMAPFWYRDDAVAVAREIVASLALSGLLVGSGEPQEPA